MTMNFDDVQVGGQLMVGTGAPPAVGQGYRRINGSLYAEGPVLFGDQSTYGRPSQGSATLMLAPMTNTDEHCPHPTDSLGVSGKLPVVLEAKGGCLIDGDLYVTGSVDCLSAGRLAARHAVADSLPKKFDIPHPSKGEGHRLAHACIEGAEVAIYHRGRLRNEKEIFLPSYWKDLVHIDSITVQLQPIGAHQDIIIKRWDDEKIYLQAKGGMPIDCFYHVYAERKDINPLTVEYKGETWEDYPDPDANDPKYVGQNTITR